MDGSYSGTMNFLVIKGVCCVTVVNTLLSAVFCAVVAVTVFVIEDRPDLWFLDPVEGGIFALLMGIYGVKCIVDNACPTGRDLEKSTSSYHSIP